MKMFIFPLSVESESNGPTIMRFRFGADYSMSSNTDIYGGNATRCEYYSLKYGIRSTVFESATSSAVVREQYTQNVFESSIYWLTDQYYNGIGVYNIHDYYESTWSQAGVDAFPNAVLGAAKPLRYPNIGTQMMYISGGLLGVQLDVPYTDWDKGIGYEGVTNPEVDPQASDTAQIIATGSNGDGLSGMMSYKNTSSQGHKTISYRNGQQGTWQLYAQYFIAGRNSSQSIISQGEWLDAWDIVDRPELSYPSTTRVMDTFADPVYTIAENIDNAQEGLENNTIPNSGWYNNFSHWHSSDMTLYESFYAMLNGVINSSSKFVWLAGMSEASEYRWFRNMVTGVSFSNNIVSVTIDNKYGLNLSEIITPISVEISVAGTPLQGKDIQADNGRVVSLGNYKFIVEVYADSLQTTISETATPDYYDFNNPSVTGESFVTDTLTIDTDVLTVATLFSDEVGTVVERKLTNETQHVFAGLSSGQTYYLGIMSRENKSIMQTINT